MSEDSQASYSPLYLEGLRLFNAEEFFESHEVWEELWSETQDHRRRYYQGLIQAAVALLHFGNGNLGGARKVYVTSRKYLEGYAPRFEGVDVSRLIEDLDQCFAELMQSHDAYPDHITLQDERIPKIALDSPVTP